MPTGSYNNIPKYRRALRSNLEQQLERAGRASLEQIDRGFARGESPAGEAWAPLTPGTIAGKGHSRILIDSGELRDSFDADVSRENDTFSLTVYSTDEKLKFHEFGTETMPKRPVMEPLARWLERDRLEDDLEDAVVNAETDAGVRGSPI